MTPNKNNWLAALALLMLSACGGGDPQSGTAASAASEAASAATAESATTAGAEGEIIARATVQSATTAAVAADVPTDTLDAARLAQQASFGATNALIAEIRARGPAKWVAQQIVTARSVYPAVGSDAIDRWTSRDVNWCDGNFTHGSVAGNYCWRDYYTGTPLAWHFYKQALTGKDQLRQRVALALSQWLVVSDVEVYSAYGMREWHQMLRDRALGNYRDLLREVILSPVMGAFLNNVDNAKTDPNENFARELLQLFTIGTCQLNHDGSLVGGSCQATYDNAKVREYAYALSGWTYPVGGTTYWCPTKCGTWRNPHYLAGRMVSVPAQHDQTTRSLLSNVTLPAVRTPEVAVERVIESLMRHPNMGPFVARRLIQHLVTSNPSPAYVDAVATAFETGSYASIGSGTRGDMAATVAAVLLRDEARNRANIGKPGYGRLREPVQLWTSVMRALDARSDGIWWAWSFGGDLGQNRFSPPSVFSYYAPDTALVGTSYVAPAFGIENEATTLGRMSLIQFANLGADSAGVMIPATTTVAGSIGTSISHARWLPVVANSAALVSQLDLLLTSGQLTTAQKTPIIEALDAINSSTYGSYWQTRRLRVAAYLVMMTPQFSIVR